MLEPWRTRLDRYVPGKADVIDYSTVRNKVNKELVNGYFGPSKGGVYSVSLQV